MITQSSLNSLKSVLRKNLTFSFDGLEILVENEQCRKHYMENRCAPETRVPAMHVPCTDWEKCMVRDPEAIARYSLTWVNANNVVVQRYQRPYWPKFWNHSYRPSLTNPW